MGHFYCRQCGVSLGFPVIDIPANLTATTYQDEKFVKHNYPTANYGINSVFDTPYSYPAYVLSASANGFYELDRQNRLNWIWDANKRVGETRYISSSATANNGVKYPRFDDPHKIHGFPTALPNTIRCSSCGCVLK